MEKSLQVKFNSLDDFMNSLPSEERKIVSHLWYLIDQSFMHYTVKLAYNVPFFYGNERICYIWPASVPWGNVNSGVALGISKGSELTKLFPDSFEPTKTKEVRTIHFSKPDSHSDDLIKSILQEAYIIDESISENGIELF